MNNIKYPLLAAFYEKLQQCKTWEEWRKCVLSRAAGAKRESALLILEQEAAANGGKLRFDDGSVQNKT